MSGIGRLASCHLFKEDEDLFTLKNLTYYKLINNLDVISYKHSETFCRHLKEGIRLPNVLCDTFIEKYHEFKGDFDDEIANLFDDTEMTQLETIHLRNCTLTDEGLEKLLRHRIKFLSLWKCGGLTAESYSLIGNVSESLKLLDLRIGPELLDYTNPEDPRPTKLPVGFFNGYPKLRGLALDASIMPDDLQSSQLQQLTYLDLSSQLRRDRINIRLTFLNGLPKLKSLILHNIFLKSNQLNEMSDMLNLKLLDISHDTFLETWHNYDAPDQTLENLVKKLPSLTHLDISGTNLNGNLGSISGLKDRREKPLQFLGLYNIPEDRLNFDDIPAIEIAGTANEEQLLTALRYNLERSTVLIKILGILNGMIHSNQLTGIFTVMNMVLIAMNKHHILAVQTLGGNIILKILTEPHLIDLNVSQKYHIVQTVLKGMEVNLNKNRPYVVLESSFKILETLKDYVFFQDERLIKVLLDRIFIHAGIDQIVWRTMTLLKYLILRVDCKAKLALNDLGIIDLMMKLIDEREDLDNIMTLAFEIMHDVIVLSHRNRRNFVENCGIYFMMRRLYRFRSHPICRLRVINFILILSHYQIMRSGLMKTEHIQLISEFISYGSFSESYIGAGIILSIALDGPEVWTIETPTRQDVLQRVNEAIYHWKLNDPEDITFISLVHLLNLLECSETPECRLFAMWTLADSLTRYPEISFQFMEQKRGHDILIELMENPMSDAFIKSLVRYIYHIH